MAVLKLLLWMVIKRPDGFDFILLWEQHKRRFWSRAWAHPCLGCGRLEGRDAGPRSGGWEHLGGDIQYTRWLNVPYFSDEV